MNEAVFLDRDGILNRAIVRSGRPYPPSKWSEFEILDEAIEGCARLKAAGFTLVCVTNQPDIARGTASVSLMERIHEELRRSLPIAEVRVCPHDDGDLCDCRKPRPGMLVQAARDFGIDLSSSYMIGDRWRDVEAGAAAGCRTVFVDRSYSEKRPTNADFEAESVTQAVTWILAQAR